MLTGLSFFVFFSEFAGYLVWGQDYLNTAFESRVVESGSIGNNLLQKHLYTLLQQLVIRVEKSMIVVVTIVFPIFLLLFFILHLHYLSVSDMLRQTLLLRRIRMHRSPAA